MKKRDFIIAFAVIAFGIIFNAIRKGDMQFSIHRSISSKAWELKDINHPHNFPQEEILIEPVDKIEIRNIAGNIEVEKMIPLSETNDASYSPKIRIIPTTYVYYKSKEQAEKTQNEIKLHTNLSTEKAEGMDILSSKKLFTIETNSKNEFPINRVRVNFKLILPQSVELNIKNKYGDIVISSGGKAITVNSKYGDITVKNISANLDIDHDYGRITLLDIDGSIKLSSRNSRVKISNASSLQINSHLSKIYINQITESTSFEYASYSTITMEDGNGFSLDGRHNRIKLKHIKNIVQIKNSHQPIYMKDISGSIIINANNCRLDMEQINATDIVIKNAYNSVAMDQLTAKNLDILMNYGDLDIAFQNIIDKINVKNKHSKITLMFPDSIQPLFNLQIQYGECTNRTLENLTLLKERQRVWGHSQQQEGKPEVIISTTYGDILLENKNKKI